MNSASLRLSLYGSMVVMSKSGLQRGFVPVANATVCPHPLLLILGSAPGPLSIARQQYYGNPSNHFWKIMAKLFDVSDQLPYSERCERLIEKRIVLWDMCKQFVRKGSSDTAIKQIETNRVDELLRQFPSIQVIACNGRTSALLLKRHVRLPSDVRVITLPSSSPAHAMKNAVAAKSELWRKLFEAELLDQLEMSSD